MTSAQHEPTPSAASWLVGAAVLGVAAGVLARVVRYLDGRPLWSDEATVAGMLLERNLASLWSPDPADPVTPVGFALAVEAAVWLFGEGERALRAVSFVAGILALPLFWQLATRCLGRRDAWLALGIFAVLEPLVFYSSELKQYATDVLIALSIAAPGAALIRERAAPGRILVFAIAAGAVGVWISLPAAFVAGGLVSALVLRGLGGDRPSLRRAPRSTPLEHIESERCNADLFRCR